MPSPKSWALFVADGWETLVFPQHANNASLDLNRGGGHNDRPHVGVGRLQADIVRFAIEAFKRGVRTLDQSHDNVPVMSGLGLFDKHVVSAHDVFVLHRITADFEYENF